MTEPRKRRSISAKMRAAIHAKFDGRCAYCGVPVVLSESRKYRMQVDHVVPFSKGGADTIDNLFPCCWRCNYWKADLDLEDFRFLCLAFREGGPYFTNRQREWIKAHLFNVDRVMQGKRGPLLFAFEQIRAGRPARSKHLIPE